MEHCRSKRGTENGDSSSFLWNQLVSGEPVVLGIDAYRPPSFKIKEQVLNTAFRAALDKRAEPCVPSSLTGIVQVSPENDGIVVLLDQVPGNPPSPLRPNVVQIPCKFDKAGSAGTNAAGAGKEEWLSKLTAAEDSWAYASLECGLGFQLAVVSGELRGRTRGPSCELALQMATPQLPLRLVPLFAIPVLRTGVQDALTAPHTAALPDFGFVTLCGDHLCFHFKHQLEDGGFNFIGVWVSGVASIQHPFIWLVCAQFVTSQRLSSRPREIFVVCVLPSPGQGVREPLFYNCLCPSPVPCLHFQLWQGSATTSVARVPSASNKTITLTLEKVLSGTAAESFHWALKELAKNRASTAPPLGQRGDSSATDDSWVPTPRPARSQAFNVAPTVPDVSDCSLAPSMHSGLGNTLCPSSAGLLPGMSEAAESRVTPTGLASPWTQGRSTAVQALQGEPGSLGAGGVFLSPAAAAQTHGYPPATEPCLSKVPTLAAGQQPLYGYPPATELCPSKVPTLAAGQQQLSPAPASVPVGVYELIRRQDEQLMELRLQIQRLLVSGGAERPGAASLPPPEPSSANGQRDAEKSVRNAATMTDAICARVVHQSVQTDKMADCYPGRQQGCTFCGRRQQQQTPAPLEIPERDCDYTLFFPEKSPHLAAQGSTRRPDSGDRSERLPRPTHMRDKTFDFPSVVSFKDGPCTLLDEANKRPETFVHPRLQLEDTSQLQPSSIAASGRDELSFQAERIAQKYCPRPSPRSGPPAGARPLVGPLSVSTQAYLRNYGLLDSAATSELGGAAAGLGGGGESMERILDISALKKLPKLL
ncbi:uncharacterized protein LOC144163076 [Haemaphysalis longicornis]